MLDQSLAPPPSCISRFITHKKVVSHRFIGQLCKQSDLYSQQGNQEILKCKSFDTSSYQNQKQTHFQNQESK